MTYLWSAAYSFHDEGSAEAGRWVMAKLRLLLEGKVGYLIGSVKAPKSVEFVDELPRNANGKVMKRVVREKYWGGAGRQVN